MIGPVISPADLAALDDNVALADVRWYLGEPGRGRIEYQAGHIPHAVHVDLDNDLSADAGPGRHPMPSRDATAERLGSLGFGDGDLIVVYDDRGGGIAARMWWMLRDIGHDKVRVLDGGITAWQAEGRPMETAVTRRPAATLSVRPGPTRSIDRAGLKTRLGTAVVLDARAFERYCGDEEPIDPIAGHIPTALSAPLTGNLGDDERFIDPSMLKERFDALGVQPGTDTIVYCGSGVTACHNALAMVKAGLPEPILYPGSWSDWSSSGEPVATGPEPGSP